MLVITRKEEQRVMIGDDIVVTVLEIRGNNVRLGFEGPSEVSIHREEVWLEIHKGEPRDAGLSDGE